MYVALQSRQFVSSDTLKEQGSLGGRSPDDRPLIPIFTLEPNPSAANSEYYIHTDTVADFCFR